MIAPEGWPALNCRDGRLPYGLMSLSEMINCSLIGLSGLCVQVSFFETLFTDHRVSPHELTQPVPTNVREQIEGWLKIGDSVATEFELRAVADRLELIRKKIEQPNITYAEMAIEMRVLKETIGAGMKLHLIYRYPNEKSEVLMRWKDQWKPVLEKFPKSGNDIFAAVDLWGLGHSTACVFHCMRVLEHGLGALAANVGLTFQLQQWQNIIDQIESAILKLSKDLPKGTERGERLRFLSTVAKEFMYFKDGWRNYVSHNRAIYDEHQARSVMEHVKTFMSVLSANLIE